METSQRIRALRGATTARADDAGAVLDATAELLGEMVARNGIRVDDIVSVFFTATDDIASAFPAEAARGLGLGDVALLCARELSVTGAPAHCVRVLMHLYSDRSDLVAVYLRGATDLRPDLAPEARGGNPSPGPSAGEAAAPSPADGT